MNKPLTCLRSTLLLLLTLGSAAGCDYFSDVVIPTFDFDPPTAMAGVYRSGQYLALSSNNGPALSYKVSSLDDYYLPFGAAIDDGGAKRLTVQGEFNRVCVQGNLAQSQSGLLLPIVSTQSGSAGSTVSNGIWDGPYLRLRNYATCNSGYTLSYVEYTWRVTAEDFGGNARTHGWAKIYWTP